MCGKKTIDLASSPSPSNLTKRKKKKNRIIKVKLG